jgi:hypothetical protein
MPSCVFPLQIIQLPNVILLQKALEKLSFLRPNKMFKVIATVLKMTNVEKNYCKARVGIVLQ